MPLSGAIPCWEQLCFKLTITKHILSLCCLEVNEKSSESTNKLTRAFFPVNGIINHFQLLFWQNRHGHLSLRTKLLWLFTWSRISYLEQLQKGIFLGFLHCRDAQLLCCQAEEWCPKGKKKQTNMGLNCYYTSDRLTLLLFGLGCTWSFGVAPGLLNSKGKLRTDYTKSQYHRFP